ncbi:MAG: MucR family transcriptional regulator [Deltaproteobacteria bacterium]|jgi:predicted transcriptional regulator|nr:MucR family transcriptional regulator [Deltaproteobacteria bacterium]
MEKYLKEALEIVRAQASVCVMTEEAISTMISKLSVGIRAIDEGSALPQGKEETGLDPAKMIKEKSITCVECGKSFKLLTKKHLATHGLTPEEYRERCGYKKGTPLVCKALQRGRRKKMQSMKLWERRGK